MLTLNSPVKTPFHRIPAGLKIGFLMVFSLALYLFESPLMLAGGFLFMVVANSLSGVKFLRLALKNLSPIYPFLIIILVWHLFTGSALDGLIIGLRLVAVFGIANLVTMTTRLDDMMNLLNCLIKPFGTLGLNLSAIGLAIGLVIRTVPRIIDLTGALSLAWRARSTRSANWRMIFPLVCLTLDDGDKVAEAIRARRVLPR